MTEAVLSFDQVSKRFGALAAVDDLSFSVPAGSVFGFLGGNGAGKTTSLRMALDILDPSAGRIEVLGAKPSRENAAAIGFLPEERGLYRKMSVLDTIVYFGTLKHMERGAAKRSAMDLLERLDLADRAKTTIDKLSKGMAQKVQVATALVNKPKLLLLDEPFSGLDPVNQKVLEELIAEHSRAGATILFSTHVMQHAERLCDRLLLLAKGRKVFEGTQDEARAALPGRLTLVSNADPARLPSVVKATQADGAEQGWTPFEIELAAGSGPEELLEYCTANGFPLRRFEVHKPSLHEVFIHFVGPAEESVR